MAKEVQRVEEQFPDGTTARSTTVRNDEVIVVERENTATRVIWFIAGVIISLLALRLALILLGANRGSAFVDFIYTVSNPFAAPFFGMFNYELEYGVSQFEMSTLVAIAVYALVAAGLSYLLTIRARR